MIHPDKVLISVSLNSDSIESMVLNGKRLLSLPKIQRPNILELIVNNIKINDLTKEGMEYLVNELSQAFLIITPRHRDEVPQDGQIKGFEGNESERMHVLRNAVAAGVQFIDYEYQHPLEVDLSESKTKLILSYHNFHHTPSLHSVIKLFKKMHKFRPNAIKKIVTTSLSLEDNYTMNRFVETNSMYCNLIAHARGEIGKDTRVKTPLNGSVIAYACESELTASDKGQITVEKLRKSMRKEYLC